VVELAVENGFIRGDVFGDREAVGFVAELVPAHLFAVLDSEGAADAPAQAVDEDLFDEFGVFSIQVVNLEGAQHAIEHVDK
jgi:hypothetical protein